jgi:hypothetical protein
VNVSIPTFTEGTTDIAGGTGSEVQYKFVINQPAWLGNNGVGAGGAQNARSTATVAQSCPSL